MQHAAVVATSSGVFPTTVELAFARFQKRRDPQALAIVFDRTAPELLRLARHLAPAGVDAEDLVQATFVTAIEAAASHRAGERVLPWLCGVLVNHARNARRAARRPLAAERLHAASGEDRDDVVAAAAQLELGAELRAAIDRLPPAYRPVLRLVCEHGLSAQEIAATLERPAGTVRAQVTRGLDLLRRALPAGLAGGAALAVGTGRGLAAVRQELLARCPGTTTGFFALLGLGGLVVLHHKLAAALGVAVLAVAAFWWVERAPTPIAATPPGGVEGVQRAQGQTASVAPDAGAERAAVAHAEPSRPDPEPTATAAAPTTATLVVHLRDGDGGSLPGYHVAVYPFAQQQELGRDQTFVATDANGEARFAGLTADRWAIDLDRGGVLGVVDIRAGKDARRTFRVPAGIRITGRVVDARGTPVAGATIVVHGSRAGTVPIATSAADGTFTAADVQAGVELQACLPGRVGSLAHAARGAAGQALALELVLGDAARTVRGTLHGPDGAPLAGAPVAILPADQRGVTPWDQERPQRRATWCRTAADGSFLGNEVGIGAQIVFANPRDRALAPCFTEIAAGTGEVAVALRAERGASVRGTCTRGGQPLVGLQIVGFPEDVAIGYLANLFGMRQTLTAADGTYTLPGLLPGAHGLKAVMSGQSAAVIASTTLTVTADSATTWDVAIGESRELAIRVHGYTAGRPLLAFAYAQGAADGAPPSMVPIQANGTGVLRERSATVDIVLAQMAGARSLIHLAARRGVAVSEGEVVFDLHPEDLPQRSITGRLVDAQRAPRPGETVTAQRVGSDLVAHVESRTGDDGTFAIGPLPAGDYVLLVGPLPRPQTLGKVTLTVARDEDAGELAEPGK